MLYGYLSRLGKGRGVLRLSGSSIKRFTMLYTFSILSSVQ
jgi:hypothetical protein